MILADKIIRLRKKNGWSQEELAEKMNVSRQAVSKWEGAQTIPDLEKVLQLGDLFGVTTDYLLKDEIEEEEFIAGNSDSTVRRISLEEAKAYLDERKKASLLIAVATFLCILSPITLILMGGAAELPGSPVSETVAAAVGLVVLFVFILTAVPMYILCSFRNEQYDFLDKDIPFELEYGVRGLVTERQKQFRNTYVLTNTLATCLCIFSPVPLIVSAFSENGMLIISMVGVLLFIVGIAVMMFITVGVRHASMQKLLKEGDYTPEKQSKSSLEEAVDSVYWCVLTAGYLIWSFLSRDWHITWIVFAAGGVLFRPVMLLCTYIANKNKKDQ